MRQSTPASRTGEILTAVLWIVTPPGSSPRPSAGRKRSRASWWWRAPRRWRRSPATTYQSNDTIPRSRAIGSAPSRRSSNVTRLKAGEASFPATRHHRRGRKASPGVAAERCKMPRAPRPAASCPVGRPLPSQTGSSLSVRPVAGCAARSRSLRRAAIFSRPERVGGRTGSPRRSGRV
jgi:hypothetical protein